MLARRVIPCLDVKDGRVVKGVQFREHRDVGSIHELAQYYCEQNADELVFYDISASGENRGVDREWITQIRRLVDIPFCVAGGIRSVADARSVFKSGADKISVNSPALERPDLINELAGEFGSQSIVIGIDSFSENENYVVHQYTGSLTKTRSTQRKTAEWVQEVIARGAGEIVLNCMNQDGMRQGYDLSQLQQIRKWATVPLIASGGAGKIDDFVQVFQQTKVEGALAASVFHKKLINIPDLKNELAINNIVVRK